MSIRNIISFVAGALALALLGEVSKDIYDAVKGFIKDGSLSKISRDIDVQIGIVFILCIFISITYGFKKFSIQTVTWKALVLFNYLCASICFAHIFVFAINILVFDEKIVGEYVSSHGLRITNILALTAMQILIANGYYSGYLSVPPMSNDNDNSRS